MLTLRRAALAALLVAGAAYPAMAQVSFSDTTDEAGVATRPDSPSILASGSAWGDFNKDGLPDLFVGNHYGTPVLYKNLGGGRFEAVTTTVMTRPGDLVAGVWGDEHGAAWADFDRDGDQDLLVLVGAQEGEGRGPNQLFVNTAGKLADQAVARTVDYADCRGRTPAWLDFDNDGWLDMFEAAMKRPDGTSPPALFRNVAGHFVDATELTGFRPIQTLSAWLSDLNRDGRMEMIFQGSKTAPVAPRLSGFNIIDMATLPFRDITPISFRSVFPDIVAADVDRDLRPDLFVCNHWALTAAVPFGHDLYLNRPTGFVHSTAESGVAAADRPSRPSCLAADFDNDMDLDIFIDAGWGWAIERSGGDLANLILWNDGTGTFTVDPVAGGAVGRLTGWADTATSADYDVDGFVDLYLTYEGELTQLYRNQGNGNHWLEIDLVGRKSNKDGVGAQVLVTAGGITQLREQTGGIHRYWGQNHQRIHVGLGPNRVASEIVVKWPSGKVRRLTNVAADQVKRIYEPL